MTMLKRGRMSAAFKKPRFIQKSSRVTKGRIGTKKRSKGQIKANKAKVPSISKLIKKADALFSIKVRMNGAWQKDGQWWNKDYTTGYEAPVKKLHCGHYLSRYYKAARWDFDNCRPQSYMTNIHMRGDPIVFRQNLIKEIGEERVLAVEAKRHQTTKLTRPFLDQLIQSLSV